MTAMGQFLPKSVMSVQLPNNGLKLNVAALRIWANSCREQVQQKYAKAVAIIPAVQLRAMPLRMV